MRYVWDLYHSYYRPDRLGLFKRMLFPVLANYLRCWDAASTTRVNEFIANSRHVASRILRHYGRQSEVIHPPVDVDFFTPGGEKQDFFLIVSALVPYKNIDLAIQTFNRKKLPLRIVGEGPERKHLESLAHSNVVFTGWISDEELRKTYRRARALVFPGEEDFGLVSVEAQACGCPVVAFSVGGIRESVIDGKTGIFFDAPTVDSLGAALDKLGEIDFNISDLRENAMKFSRGNFQKKFLDFLHSKFHDPDKKQEP
jgi:glycosyltransferase involved in cell wall biosynthesis